MAVCVYHLGDNRCFVFFFMKKKKNHLLVVEWFEPIVYIWWWSMGASLCVWNVFWVLAFFYYWHFSIDFVVNFFLLSFFWFHLICFIFFPQFCFHFISFLLFFLHFERCMTKYKKLRKQENDDDENGNRTRKKCIEWIIIDQNIWWWYSTGFYFYFIFCHFCFLFRCLLQWKRKVLYFFSLFKYPNTIWQQQFAVCAVLCCKSWIKESSS